MKSLKRLFAATLLPAALGLLMTISGCGTIEQRQTKQVIAAATVQGQLAARPIAPKKPAECERHMVRVYHPQIGDKNRSSQCRWLYNADLIDAQIDRCNRFIDDWAKAQ